ncbi:MULTISPECIES: DNA mismatch repair protein MutS [Halobacterium]|uniref:DNA mismatch repair protein MutS n=2 Tax=Halobacterium salinarum TaxID=2242 RepID=A0A4D6GRB5_HALS9|nr:DNA mismatch repair protein MutS [Halobacterium salinarum]MDL0123690.1 DNA mismatch repair protein MutS [Halobacterium salinarum]MDL0124543.1 DNA mismatch repair protein MutS [Halobacterium salinarum]MDL0128848.1 DNA mismatch repair protein MutS [Halobacterium salinarum]MDL0129482.1 DNA mismatch repair protein MutS [Halobacterium salinarum]MDL0134105.1 DNA mismatch repair protein MutS [Halobacterium salinarum]
MDAALGPPDAMAASEGDLTPMMSQYFELTRRYDDALVLFQVGDFYELFCAAAETAARICEVTLTAREDSTGQYPMAGVPIDTAEPYIEALLDAGYRVAVADQVQDPDEVSGVVDRAVTRVVTPGTVTEDELLGGADNNFVAALAGGRDADAGFGLALLDVSTGDCYATRLGGEARVRDELGRFAPAELVVGPGVDADRFADEAFVAAYDDDAFEPAAARERVADYFGGEDALPTAAELRACGALLSYAEYTRGGAGDSQRLTYLNHVTRYSPTEHLQMDAVALRSLELFEQRSVHGTDGTALVDVLDETACALGRRKLTDWLRRPLVDSDAIAARHDAVGELVADPLSREELHEHLRDVYDIERLVSRVSRGRANARDLRALADTLAVVPEVRGLLADADARKLQSLREALDDLPEIRGLLDRAIVADPPQELTDGGVIRDGYDERLDDLRATERAGKQWVDDLEASERERTGVDSLKVGQNSVHGYYIEVTKANMDAVPEDYQRRQTLKNAERYVTPELKEREEEIVRAEQRAQDLEYELFVGIRERVAEAAERMQAVARALAAVDALASFAAVAAAHDYTKPVMGGDGIHIEGGRHPVVERTESGFVPNDTTLNDDRRVAVITGPNMSGKSTYMRQVAVIVVLAQAGCFVPAAAAELRVVDRVFTRVGASDDIAGGRSTFMVEMTELASILRAATDESLVLLDEVGRGTATTDGLAIARAVTEHIHDAVGATTLFATHHHELTADADRLPDALNLHFAATRGDDGVAFEHAVRAGAATASYGVEVARTAGVPEPVVDRARELLDAPATADGGDGGTTPTADANGQRGAAAGIVAELRDVSVAELTPIEALNVLNDLASRVD